MATLPTKTTNDLFELVDYARIKTAIESLQDKENGKGLSTNDFTDAAEAKLGATVVVTDSEKTAWNSKEASGVAASLVNALKAGSTETIASLKASFDALNTLVTGTTPDGDAIVNRIQEILDIFSAYPEGVSLITTLAGKEATGVAASLVNALKGGVATDGDTLAKLRALIAANNTAKLWVEDTDFQGDGTGDGSGTGTGTKIQLIPRITAGTYGSATQIPVVVTNAKGVITGISAVAASGVGGTATTNASDLTSGTLADARLSNVGAAETFGGGADEIIASITTDAKGRVTGKTKRVVSLAANYTTSVRMARAMGSTMTAENFSHELMTSGNLPLVSSNLLLVAVDVPVGGVMAGVGYFIRLVGNFTAANENRIGLYSYDATNGATLLASTANDATGGLYKVTANTYTKLAFTSPVTLLSGVYYIGFLYNSTGTDTQVANLGVGTGASQQSHMVVGGVGKFMNLAGPFTTLPASISQATLAPTGNIIQFRPYSSLYA